jgi:hypothetical protein
MTTAPPPPALLIRGIVGATSAAHGELGTIPRGRHGKATGVSPHRRGGCGQRQQQRDGLPRKSPPCLIRRQGGMEQRPPPPPVQTVQLIPPR